MSDERIIDEEAIFSAALAIDAADQQLAYLRQACGDDTALLARLEALLKVHASETSVIERVANSLQLTVEAPLMVEGPGTVIDRYKLLEKIGEGGMAVVYMAEQQEPIRRKVALKIIKLGMDTRQVIARFEAERQALALMDHPSIAKVLDAGATETGRPYFVMELVTGVSITEYCDKNNLSTKDRLALFLQVCHAVQHAHQKGIIHRDLKPSNVMVTHHDGKPIPKVIDFGIAKATNQRLTEKTLFTRYAHIIGTPAYMSPEQAELSDLDIDTRTDIYSLGVLLYELLTGTTPFSEEELRKVGYVEMQRVIREQEPVKPSTRIRTALRGASVPARLRTSCEDARPPKKAGPRWPCDSMGGTPMLREVRGDLDWIVMKSLEKDRARRYETANGLAEDVRRHLEHEPILARGPRTTYRLCKFLRRHRWQTIAVLAAVVIAGAAVVLLSLWNRDRSQLAEAQGFKHRNILSRAREQYAKADREAALETIKPMLNSRHVGPEAQLLQAGILVDNRRSKEAVTILNDLVSNRPEIAGAAHALLARILWEGGSPNAQKLEEIEGHRRQAEALLPETAEAYFLRAMTALTVKEQLAALDKALKLDPSHYEARRLRAYTYYASRKYDRLQADALGMTILRPRDPLGYSLRAVAWRESGRYQDAIADYNSALALTTKDSPMFVDLSTQRSETLLRMGDYEPVIADAVGAKDLSPLRQCHVFSALTALGDYDKATTLFRQIISPGYDARSKFQEWCMKYVFDTLEAGRSWHPADRTPVGPAFLPMVEAEENYRDLAAKGRRLTTEGFSAAWAPDGRKLAFSLGVQGRSGVAIFDPATKETDLLIVPGKDPKWSPDARYIAFVRDRQNLRLEELAAAEGESKQPPVTDEEVWLMSADGTEPRRLARGSWPSWGRDSEHLYYLSRGDGTLCSLALARPDTEPKPLMKCSNVLPSVSPDHRQVAYFEQGALKIKDLASQAPIADCPMSSLSWGVVAWSPTGNEVLLGGGNPARQRTGLWLYDLTTREFSRVLDGQMTATCWSPAGTDLAFCLGEPYSEIWAARLNPNVSVSQDFGPRRVLRDHYREMVAFYTRRIKADPMDADAYLRRAQQYHYLHQERKVCADMRQYTAIVTQSKPLDGPSDMPWDVEHVINGPFGHQLIFSVEQREDAFQVLCVAFGQKGRGNMKSFEIPLFVTSLLGLCLVSGLDTPPARADFTFGEPMNLGSIVNSSDDESYPSISADGLTLYFSDPFSPRPGGHGGADIWVTTRETINDDWATPVNLGSPINTSADEVGPCLSADGLSLFFSDWPTGTARPGGKGRGDIWVATRATTADPWGKPVNLGPVNSTSYDSDPSISADGLILVFGSGRSGGYGGSDIWMATRATPQAPWSEPVNLGPGVNSSSTESHPCISPDGLAVFFGSTRLSGGSYCDLFLATRSTTTEPFGPALNLAKINMVEEDDDYPSISFDGRVLFFESTRPGGYGVWDLWQASIIPNCDFNGDGKVDEKDLLVMAQHWGQNYPRCDVGPFSWGDGVVDAQDLRVLMETIVGPGFVLSPKPHAIEVPRDVILSWTSPQFATAHDVYFGTSFEDVSKASRSNPLGVLVSKGQTATTYDPEGPLEFGRTYYWRIDEVGSAPDFTIYRGSVLDFKTEVYAYPITTKIIATASSAQPGMGPEETVDGSGLDKNDLHATDSTTMWLSAGVSPNWIQFEFDQVYALHELWVWNSNSEVEPFIGFGAKSVKIEHSMDGATWTALANVPEFARASGQPGYTANTTVSFGGVSAKYVKLTINKNWGTTPQTGVSEVRFFYIPVYPSQPAPTSEQEGVDVDVTLIWKAGRQAASHRVYFSADRQAVANGTAPAHTVSNNAFDPGSLDLSKVYYWRVDEVNEARTPSVRQGNVWSFSTKEYRVVDDFESYTDEEGHRIYQTWIDGETNQTGSRVGYPQSPFAEQMVIHGGEQAMPFEYNNVKMPFYSQAERTFSPVQNWTSHGADTLVLYVQGREADFDLRHAGTPPVIDGEVDAVWANVPALPIKTLIAGAALTGPADASGQFRVLYDATNLYVLVDVNDDQLRNDSAAAYLDDSVEFYIDGDNTKTGVLTGNARQYTFGWSATDVQGTNTAPRGVQHAQVNTPTGWRIEIKLPWGALTGAGAPVGRLIGLDCCYNDDDDGGDTRESQIAWRSRASSDWNAPASWGTARVAAPGVTTSPDRFYLVVQDSSNRSAVATYPGPEILQAGWTEWRIPLREFTSAGVDLTAVKKLILGVGDRNKATPGGKGAVYIDDIGVGHPAQ